MCSLVGLSLVLSALDAELGMIAVALAGENNPSTTGNRLSMFRGPYVYGNHLRTCWEVA